jgi:hypothetical protein
LVIVDLKVGKFGYADAGQMHLYLNYAREHWVKPGENPPVGLILCTEKGVAEVHYALDNLPDKVLAAEYRTVLPDEKLIADTLQRSQAEIQERKTIAQMYACRPLPDLLGERIDDLALDEITTDEKRNVFQD